MGLVPAPVLVTTVPKGSDWLTPSQEVAPQTVLSVADSVTTMSSATAEGLTRLHSSACALPLETLLTNERLSAPPFQVTLETVAVLTETPTRSRRLVPPTVCDQVKLEASAGVHAEAESNMPGTGVAVGVAVGVGVDVEVAVGVGVEVAVEVTVGVGVAVDVAVAVGVGVDVAVGHGPGHGVAVAVGVGVAQLVPPVAIRTDPKVSGWNPVASLWTPPP